MIECTVIHQLVRFNIEDEPQELLFESPDRELVEAQKVQYSKQQDCSNCKLRVDCLVDGCFLLKIMPSWMATYTGKTNASKSAS